MQPSADWGGELTKIAITEKSQTGSGFGVWGESVKRDQSFTQVFCEAGECKNVGITDEVGDGAGRVGGLLPGALDDGGFAGGEAGAFEEERTDLALELANGPVAFEAFVFVAGGVSKDRRSQ